MKCRHLILAGVIFLIASIALGSAQAAELTPVYTPASGSTVYVLGTGVTAVANKFMPEANFVHEATNGTMDMIRRMQKRFEQNKPVIGLFGAPEGYKAYMGEGDFSASKFDGLRAVAFLAGSDQYFVVPADSSIKSYADVKGKRIGVGGPGSTIANNAFFFFEQHGAKKEDFKFFFYQFKEVVEGIQNKSLDGGFLGGNYPMPSYTELSLQHPVRIVPVDEKVFDEILPKVPYYYKRVIPAGAYKGHDKDTLIFAFSTVIWAHTKMSDDLVYNFLKNLFEHRTEYYPVHKSAEKDFVLENLTKGVPIPYHPGAEKYLREIGALK
jgi:TRAP transporter TAXI family solute receptor